MSDIYKDYLYCLNIGNIKDAENLLGCTAGTVQAIIEELKIPEVMKFNKYSYWETKMVFRARNLKLKIPRTMAVFEKNEGDISILSSKLTEIMETEDSVDRVVLIDKHELRKSVFWPAIESLINEKFNQ